MTQYNLTQALADMLAVWLFDLLDVCLARWRLAC